MSDRYEVALTITNTNYLDQLIVCLVRQGYDVYYNDSDYCGNDNGVLCFTTTDEEITKIKESNAN
jgi:hypothetical protein